MIVARKRSNVTWERTGTANGLPGCSGALLKGSSVNWLGGRRTEDDRDGHKESEKGVEDIHCWLLSVGAQVSR